jgi:hypothetical protein
MEGVILYADDKVLDQNTPENRLYLRLAKRYPVLAAETIELADRAIQSIGTFSAVIVDWEFKREVGGIEQTQNPDTLLRNSDFYSLIYVFSNLPIPNSIRRSLKRKFGKRIVFKRKASIKNPTQNLKRNFNRIRDDITNWQIENPMEIIPQNWSNSINQSSQVIFSKLSKADPNWIVELHKSAGDAVNPEVQVISLLQSLLLEKICTNQELVRSIKNLIANPPANTTNDGVAELFQKIYYTDLRGQSFPDVPIMTGDIFRLGSKNTSFGIIVTPECDIRKVVNNGSETFQILRFRISDFKDFLWKSFNSDGTAGFNFKDLKADKKKRISEWFNQPNEKLFFLPSLPFRRNEFTQPAIIDFSSSLAHLNYLQIKQKTRICRLNIPFIQQLRQKYLSYIGRVGVPTVPDALRSLNLINL